MMYTEEQWRALTESEYAQLCNSSSEEGWLAGAADYVWNALAVLGMVAVAVVVGLAVRQIVIEAAPLVLAGLIGGSMQTAMQQLRYAVQSNRQFFQP